ncbi:hypothetical protein VTH82DRAFT_4530 [Thermothelomyces myriococcoides]
MLFKRVQPKIKVQLKLAIARLRMVQKRDEALSRTQRRAMATLLEQGKVESARIRVENIIRSDITTELHEILELYCELLLARAGLLESSPTCDPGLEEAVKSIIYAAPKTEIKELLAVRALLADKFGKEFVLQAMENRDGRVSERVIKKLSVAPPKEELVQGYLEEIAKAYGVDWPPGRGGKEEEDLGEPPDFMDEEGGNVDGDGSGGSGGQAVKQQSEKPPVGGAADADIEDDEEAGAREELSKATPPKSFGPASPLQVNPPSMSTENVHPKVTLNKVELTPTKKPAATAAARKPAEKKQGSSDGIPDVDELAKRFAALKRMDHLGRMEQNFEAFWFESLECMPLAKLSESLKDALPSDESNDRALKYYGIWLWRRLMTLDPMADNESRYEIAAWYRFMKEMPLVDHQILQAFHGWQHGYAVEGPASSKRLSLAEDELRRLTTSDASNLIDLVVDSARSENEPSQTQPDSSNLSQGEGIKTEADDHDEGSCSDEPVLPSNTAEKRSAPSSAEGGGGEEDSYFLTGSNMLPLNEKARLSRGKRGPTIGKLDGGAETDAVSRLMDEGVGVSGKPPPGYTCKRCGRKDRRQSRTYLEKLVGITVRSATTVIDGLRQGVDPRRPTAKSEGVGATIRYDL